MILQIAELEISIAVSVLTMKCMKVCPFHLIDYTKASYTSYVSCKIFPTLSGHTSLGIADL